MLEEPGTEKRKEKPMGNIPESISCLTSGVVRMWSPSRGTPLLLAGLLWLDCHWKHSVEEHAPQKAHESALREEWEQVKSSPADVRCVFITHQFNTAQDATEQSSGGCLLPGDPQSGVA